MQKKTMVGVAMTLMVSAGLSIAQAYGDQAGARRVATTTLYLKQCSTCHGQKGEGKPGVRPLNGPLAHGNSVEDIEQVIREGVKGTTMQAFKGSLNDTQIRSLAEFVHEMSK